MVADRVESLKRKAESRPNDPRARFGLALEYERLGRWEETIRELKQYLSMTSDEGNAYGRLARALRQVGRDEEARQAYLDGIEAAYRHAHPTMAGEFQDQLDDM